MKNRFMHLSLVLPLLLGFESALALAQERPAIRAQPNTVYVGADGKFEAVPDTALVQFNISAQNIDAAKIKAVEDAFRHARGEAAAVAVAGGRSLGELSYSSVDTLEQVRVLQGMRSAVPMATGRMAEMNAAPIAEFSPQKIVITAHVNALFNLK